MRSGVEVCLYLSIAGPAFPCRAPREKIEGDDGTGEGRVSHIKMLSGAGGGGAGGGAGDMTASWGPSSLPPSAGYYSYDHPSLAAYR